MQTRRGAEQHERQVRDELSRLAVSSGYPSVVTSPTFGAFAEQWLRDYVEPRNRPSTVYSKRTALRTHLVPTFRTRRLDEISTAEIDAFIAATRRSGLAPKTTNNLLSMLRCCLSCAVEWGQLAQLPRFRWQRIPVQGYRYLEPEAAMHLLHEACALKVRPQFWYTLLLFLLRTGARFGEAAALKWTDITLDSEGNTARLWRSSSNAVEGPTKTNRHRDVPLSSDIAQELARLPRHYDHVFRIRQDSPIRPSSLQCTLSELCRRAGLPHTSWKDLRHTFATDLTRRGVPLGIVQRLLGHSTIQMTTRYAHVPEESLKEAVELLAIRPATMRAASHDVGSTRIPDHFGRLSVTSQFPPREPPNPLPPSVGSTNAKTDSQGSALPW